MNVLFIIPARGGSKGIPRKNVRSLAGKPLISYSIKNALAYSGTKDVYVSSEDDEILNIAKKNGAKTHKRNMKLSTDEITLDAVIYDAYEQISALEGKKYDLIVTLQPTSPLLKVSAFEQALKQMIDTPEIDTIISATEDTHLSWRKENDRYLPNYTERLNRQYLTPSYKETGGFLITRNSIITPNTRIGKRVELFELDSKQSIDIDNYEDWNSCEYYLKKKRILFLVSGYTEIGLGHIYNTLIVANEILNHEVLFFCDAKSKLGYDKIVQNNYTCHIQEGEHLIEEVLALAPDVIIHDKLDSKKEDVLPFKEKGVQLIHFEDLGEGARVADLVFNAIYPEKEELPNHFFGPSYFCARDEFILSPTIEVKPKVSTILIAFGGVDPNNLTLKTLEAIYDQCMTDKIAINVVMGFGYQHLDTIEKFERINVYRNVSNISEFMSNADVVFTSAGRTTYELAILGVPSIVLAQNDREMTHFFATESYGFLNLGKGIDCILATIKGALQQVLPQETREEMQKKMLSTDLRNGKKRVVATIKNFIDKDEFS